MPKIFMLQHLYENRIKQGNEKGYIILISVIIISAVGAVIATTIILLTLGSGLNSHTQQESYQAKAMADACVEQALQMILDSVPYEGSDSLTINNGTCTYTVTKLTGQNRIITSLGQVGNVFRKVKVELDKITPSINIVSWQEVADF